MADYLHAQNQPKGAGKMGHQLTDLYVNGVLNEPLKSKEGNHLLYFHTIFVHHCASSYPIFNLSYKLLARV